MNFLLLEKFETFLLIFLFYYIFHILLKKGKNEVAPHVFITKCINVLFNPSRLTQLWVFVLSILGIPVANYCLNHFYRCMTPIQILGNSCPP